MQDLMKYVKTLSPVMGCDLGCEYCYAKNINKRFHHMANFSKPMFFEYRLTQLYSGSPKVFNLTSMSDFSSWCKNGWTERVFSTLSKTPLNQYLLQTICPEECNFTTDLDNVWFGTSVTTNADLPRIEKLQEGIKAKHHYISFEPLFEDLGEINLKGIDWVIVGAETGSRKERVEAQRQWVENIVKQAQEQNVPLIMKSSLIAIVGEEGFIQQVPAEFEKLMVRKSKKSKK